MRFCIFLLEFLDASENGDVLMLKDILKLQMLALQLEIDGFFFLRGKILEF